MRYYSRTVYLWLFIYSRVVLLLVRMSLADVVTIFTQLSMNITIEFQGVALGRTVALSHCEAQNDDKFAAVLST